MKRTNSILLPLLLSVALLLTGCGAGNTTKGNPSSTPSGSPTAANSATTSTTTPGDCPTENTRSFAKTRFVADVGLAAGTFRRYILKPYQAGKFQSGADGRLTAMLKAGVVAAIDAKLINNAIENAKANPTLCKVLVGPLTQVAQTLPGIKDKILKGDFASVLSIESLLATVLGTAKQHGLSITPNGDLNSATQAQNAS